jgi:hypothetical protein
LAGWNVDNFFVAPSEGGKAYQLYIEGDVDLAALAAAVDERLQAAHALYANLRRNDVALGPLVATRIPPGTIQRFVGGNRQFGQGKFLHLYDTREIPEQILRCR